MRYKYSVNKNNQLTLNGVTKKKIVVINGRFRIGKNNQLSYFVDEPASWRKKYALPKEIILTGKWKFNSNYDLEICLRETRTQFKDNLLILKGEIISPDRDNLAFELKSYDRRGFCHIQILSLSGTWKANAVNQICFEISKKTDPDILILQGSWQVNSNQQIIYKYEKTQLKRKTKVLKTLIFQGLWQINSVNVLTYILSRSTNSCFDFRVHLESPSLYPQDGVIKYRLGIGIKGKGFKEQIISLYGAWKFSRKWGLTFQMDYGDKRIESLEFGANYYLTKNDEIAFSLTNRNQQPLGGSLIFTHRFLKKNDSETFLRLKKLSQENRIEAGVRIPF